MDRLSRRVALLAAALTVVGVGAGIVAASPIQKVRALGWLIIALGVGLVAGTYIQDWLASRKEGRPSLPRDYKLISYENRPYHLDPSTPFLAAMQFRTVRDKHPVRLEVVCSGLIQSAAAIVEDTRDGRLFEGWGFQPIVTENRAYFGFSTPVAEPRFVFFVEVRSAEPVRIVEVRSIKRGPLEDSPADLVALTSPPPGWPRPRPRAGQQSTTAPE